jgi:hypothetical protein
MPKKGSFEDRIQVWPFFCLHLISLLHTKFLNYTFYYNNIYFFLGVNQSGVGDEFNIQSQNFRAPWDNFTVDGGCKQAARAKWS